MIDIKKILKLNRLTLLLILFALLLILVPITYSKFTSLGNSNIKIDTAFYLLENTYESRNIKITDLMPSDNVFTYNFSVANYNNNKRADTDIEYTLKITTTTNLPLTYALYLNEQYDDNDSTNIITSDIVAPDEDGTYFKNMTTDPIIFSHNTNEENIYQLTVIFPAQYDSFDYQDIVEGIIISVDSKQVIEEETTS